MRRALAFAAALALGGCVVTGAKVTLNLAEGNAALVAPTGAERPYGCGTYGTPCP